MVTTVVAFIRGIECQCSAEQDPNSLGKILDAEECRHECDTGIPFLERNLRFCGGNLGFSVYSASSIMTMKYNEVRLSSSQEFHPSLKSGLPLGKVFKGDDHVLPINVNLCGQCQGSNEGSFNPCIPNKISPAFDYFPNNSAQNCANFCASNINYFEVNWKGEQTQQMIRQATPDAFLLWWNATTDGVTLPICMCGDRRDFHFPFAGGFCLRLCPGNLMDMCGGMDMAHSEVFVSVYCIEIAGKGQCPVSGTTTTTIEISTSATGKTTFPTTLKSTTVSTSTNSVINTTTSQTPVTEKPAINISTITPTQEAVTTSPYDSSNISDMPSTISFEPTTTTPISLEPVRNACKKTCHQKDRHGYEWSGRCNHTSNRSCSCLIPNSTGMAFWDCNENGEFETAHPDVSQCQSEWLEKVEQEIKGLNRTVIIGL